MERHVAVICFVVGLLGLVCAALGFAAEANRTKGSTIDLDSISGCAYIKASYFGFIAALLLLIAQIIVTVAAKCVCCKKTKSKHRTPAVLYFVVSWVLFVIAIVMLVFGIAINEQHDSCYAVRPGIFAGAAVLSLCAVIFGLSAFVTKKKFT